MPRSEAQRLQDMREACERIAGFLRGMDFDAFQADQRTVRAVLCRTSLRARQGGRLVVLPVASCVGTWPTCK